MKKEVTGLLIFYLFLIALVILLWGCSSVKQVLKSPTKTNKVVWSWMQNNPFKNDTTFIKGVDSFRVDTLESTEAVYVDCPEIDKATNQPVKVKCPPAKIIYKQNFRTDTVKWEDFNKLNILKSELSDNKGQITQLTKSVKSERQRGNKFLWLFIGVIGLWVLITVIKFYLKYVT